MKRRGTTVVESLVAFAILTIVLLVLYTFLSKVFSTARPSVTGMTSASFVRQDVRLAFQKLMDRLEEGIEVLAPAPGKAAATLDFKDVLNHSTSLGLTPAGDLVTFNLRTGARTPEAGPETVPTATGSLVREARPVKVPGVKGVLFQVLSPTLVTIVLTVADANQTGHLVATARLRNSRLADR